MSVFTDAFDRVAGQNGLIAISVGLCPGCAVCISDYGYQDTEDNDGNVLETAESQFERDYEAGDLCDEGSFSQYHCEGCGSHFGGDRYDAHGLNQDNQIVHFSVCVDCLQYIANGDEPEGVT